jgi:osmotically-inducible protein OsmY
MILLSITVALITLLQGCAGLIVGAAGGAALAMHDRRDSGIILKDEKIESLATDKIYSDPKLKNNIHVNITSYNQVVLLTGEVHTAELQDYVVSIVRNIPNIRRVHNELVVRNLTSFGSRSNDTLITSKIKTEMLGTKGFDATRVKVVTENRKVYLMGLVTDKEAALAVDIARNVKNVKQVIKIFEIIPEPFVDSAPVAEGK